LGTRKILEYTEENEMGDYSFVRDKKNEIIGFWIKDPAIVKDRDRLSMLVIAALMKEGIPESQIQIVTAGILSGLYRVVPNKSDNNGGNFVMLGNEKEPGENIVLNCLIYGLLAIPAMGIIILWIVLTFTSPYWTSNNDCPFCIGLLGYGLLIFIATRIINRIKKK
jgi:hypothetical protein